MDILIDRRNQKTILKGETFVRQKVVKKQYDIIFMDTEHLVFEETFDLLDKSPSFFGFIFHEVNLTFL